MAAQATWPVGLGCPVPTLLISRCRTLGRSAGRTGLHRAHVEVSTDRANERSCRVARLARWSRASRSQGAGSQGQGARSREQRAESGGCRLTAKRAPLGADIQQAESLPPRREGTVAAVVGSRSAEHTRRAGRRSPARHPSSIARLDLAPAAVQARSVAAPRVVWAQLRRRGGEPHGYASRSTVLRAPVAPAGDGRRHVASRSPSHALTIVIARYCRLTGMGHDVRQSLDCRVAAAAKDVGVEDELRHGTSAPSAWRRYCAIARRQSSKRGSSRNIPATSFQGSASRGRSTAAAVSPMSLFGGRRRSTSDFNFARSCSVSDTRS